MKSKTRIFLKIIEFLVCVTCVGIKIYTDLEAGQIFYVNQKLSREWGLLHNITWSSAGNSFANITYGGYTLITALMVITRCIDSKSHPTIMEKIFLAIGVILFFSMGGLVFAALDQVPTGLEDNAIILGCLSFIVGFLFLFDLTDPLRSRASETTQTDNIIVENRNLFKPNVSTQTNGNIPVQEAILSIEHNIEHQRNAEEDLYGHTKKINIVESTNYPTRQSPVFAKVNAGPEKKKPYQSHVPNPQANKSQAVYWTNVRENSPVLPPQINRESRSRSSYEENSGFIVDDFYPKRQSLQQSTYVRGSIVDQDNFILKSKKTECCHRKSQQTNPATPGYVANIARMWESRSRSKSPILHGLQTNV